MLFLKARNKEQSRYLILGVSTIIVVLSLIAGYFSAVFSDEQIVGLELGVLGSYVSIWSRFGKMNMTGLASKDIHYLEAFARLFCGGIFAFVAILFIDTGLVLKDITVSNPWAYHCIVGFIAGFNERFVPSIIESFTSNVTEEKSNDYETKLYLIISDGGGNAPLRGVHIDKENFLNFFKSPEGGAWKDDEISVFDKIIFI